MDGICSIEGCDKPERTRGWCGMHYARWNRYGDTSTVLLRRVNGTEVERFWPKVDKGGPAPVCAPHLGPCWLWVGCRDAFGYGCFGSLRAHRWSWTDANGPIPEGLQLDHLCRVPSCVRPSHLEPVTPLENVRRAKGVVAANLAKTHCQLGHPYDEANTIRRGTRRICRQCEKIRNRARYLR